jgi:hypothetical protein
VVRFWQVRESLTSRPALGLAKHINPSIQWVGGLSTGVKWPRHKTYHSIPFSPGVRDEWTCTCTPLYGFMPLTGTNLPSTGTALQRGAVALIFLE